MSSDRSVLSIEPKTTRRKLSVMRTEVETVSGQLTPQQRLDEDAKKNATDEQYDRDGAKAKIRHLRVTKAVRRKVLAVI